MAVFASPEFLEEVLNGLAGWGKAKYDEIAQLISRVGEPFVTPLLDRLAEEQNMSLRRYYMERLRELGPLARDAAISRLRDNRWYFVRNLVLVLRSLEDQSVIPHVRRITGHQNPRVRQEAIRTLLSFRDPEADQLLLRDMDSSNAEARITAVKLAEFSENPEVHRRLLGFLSQGGLTGFEYELKSAAIHSLGMIGNPAVLQELERFLKSRSLLRAGQLSRLKAELVQSLKHYPRQAVAPLLKSLATSGQRQLRSIAEELSRNL
jgi:HEAT repeat protein